MKIYIDIGHGGNDPGAVSGAWVEYNMNSVTGNALAERLREYGHDVKVEQGHLSLGDSARAANSFKADLILSQHYNAGGGDRGEVIYAWKDGSLDLANAVAEGLKKAGQTEVRVYKSKANSTGTAEYFGILRMSYMPGVIIEPCFIDNVVDRTLADTVAKQKNIGICIADAIVTHYGGAIKEDIDVLAKIKLDTQVNLPDVKVTLNGSDKENAVILNVDGKDTTYIPAVILRDIGMGVVWDGATKTVKITK